MKKAETFTRLNVGGENFQSEVDSVNTNVRSTDTTIMHLNEIQHECNSHSCSLTTLKPT